MYLKVTLKNHKWFYGDGGPFERWLAGVHGAIETNETTDETNETTDETNETTDEIR